MPFKDPEAKKAYAREYMRRHYAEHGAEQRAKQAADRAENPEKYRAAARAEYARHREAYNTRGKAYYAEHRETRRAYECARTQDPDRRAYNDAYRLKYRFGLTAADYDAMLASQNGVCASCGCPETHRDRLGRVTRLAVDHNHATDAIRSLLCHGCNTGIGCLGDDPVLLRLAADYLERHLIP
jgi:hypothetical protein